MAGAVECQLYKCKALNSYQKIKQERKKVSGNGRWKIIKS
jgi:hypothetical protein